MARSAIRTALLVAALLAAQPARADFEAGQQAWDAGRPEEALTQWRAAADAGDGRAMLALGRRYLQGLGVLQDYVEAHMWFNLAASRSEAAALGDRDAVAEKMTPAQIATAQQRTEPPRPDALHRATQAGDIDAVNAAIERACCAAAPGTTTRGTSAPPTATGTPPGTATTTTGSELSARSTARAGGLRGPSGARPSVQGRS